MQSQHNKDFRPSSTSLKDLSLIENQVALCIEFIKNKGFKPKTHVHVRCKRCPESREIRIRLLASMPRVFKEFFNSHMVHGAYILRVGDEEWDLPIENGQEISFDKVEPTKPPFESSNSQSGSNQTIGKAIDGTAGPTPNQKVRIRQSPLLPRYRLKTEMSLKRFISFGDGMRYYSTFPYDSVGGFAGRFSDVYSEYVECPREFLTMSFLTVLGTKISTKITLASQIRPQTRLYVVLLGESASDRKSEAIRQTLNFFDEFDLNSKWTKIGNTAI